MNGGDELDGACKSEAGGRLEGGFHGGDEAGDVDSDVDEDVEGGNAGGGDGDKAGVAVVDEEVGGESGGSEVIDAAGAIGWITKDGDIDGVGGEGSDDIGDGEGVHEEAIGELEDNTASRGGSDAVEGLVDLEFVVAGKDGDGGIEGGVREEEVRNLGLHEALRQWLLLRSRVRVWERGGEESSGALVGIHGGGEGFAGVGNR